MKNGFVALVLCSFLAGCSSGPLSGAITAKVGNDLVRTSELAQAYGKPAVAQCANWMIEAMKSEDSLIAKIDALKAEPTEGLLSAALKATLIAEAIRSLDNPAQRAQMEAEFRANCSAVAGDIMLDIARDAAKISKKRIGL